MIFNFKNIPIHYETFGTGSVIVLLHGFLESSAMWDTLIPQFLKKNTILTIDFPGHGKSGVISKTHSMELMAEVVDAIIEHLQISSATFVGHSMGGYITLAYADLFPEKINSLVLLNSTTTPDSEERKKNRNRALKILDKSPKAYIGMAIENLIAPDSKKEFAQEINALKTEANSFPLEGIKAAIRGMRDRKDRTEVLLNFNKRKHMILAEEDPIMPISDVKKIGKYCGASVKIIGGGHMSMIENRETVLKYLHFIL